MASIAGALISAQAFCWDETIGYQMGGNMNPNTDCSGMIWQSLHDNGFNVGSYRFDTSNMGSILRAAGFTEYTYNSSFQPQPGDIFMYNEYVDPQHFNGHAFFYAENVRGYVNGYHGWDSSSCDGTIGICARAKIEASGTHNHPENGDQDNGYGAHTEVWVHTFSSLTYGSHTWYVYRYGGGPEPPIPTDIEKVLLFKFNKKKKGGRTLWR